MQLVCKNCFKPISKNSKFCSSSCAASFNNKGRVLSQETKRKMSLMHKGISRPNRLLFTELTCPICKNSYKVKPCFSKRIYCSNECKVKDKNYLFKKRPKTGGLREGSGRSHSGRYKGIFCNSTYELVFLIYCLDHKIPIKRFKSYLLLDNGRKYYPDFLCLNKVVETKGYIQDLEKLKSQEKSVLDVGYEFELLTKDKLKIHFDYVSQTYTKDYTSLYDKV